jgi:hypothetical protein
MSLILPFGLFGTPIDTTPVAIAYQSRSATESTTTVYSYSLSSGTASSDRRLIIGVSATTDSPDTSSAPTVTVGGASATLLVSRTDNPPDGTVTALYGIDAPTGTTASINLTFASNQRRAAVALWSMTGANSLTPRYTYSGITGDVISNNITISPRGGAIALATWRTTSSGTWTNMTRDFTGSVGSTNDRQEGGHFASLTAINSRTVTIERSGAFMSWVMASFQ